MKATVLVRPKSGILDPQGQAVENSLRHLGFAVDEAKVGRLVELDIATEDAIEARSQIERMCEQLLANPLIESYEIELHEEQRS
jgi:phosphoribosylformylglycinamidine synthase subunit PurS